MVQILNGPVVNSSIITAGRCASVTEKGMVGIGPRHILAGDLVTIIAVASVPFNLRRDGQGTCRLLVGEAYVQEFMDGEVVYTGLADIDIDIDLYYYLPVKSLCTYGGTTLDA
ncbi:hypothetical protein WAI453_005563 [Rhynchosporium graminicola]